jgi:hypothetical protein
MPVVEEPLWRNPGNPGMIVVCAHAGLNPPGKLYLGYGEALEAVRRIPEIEEECAYLVSQSAVDGVYGFLPVRPSRPEERLVGFGLFQTRYDWTDPESLELIETSMAGLREFANQNTDLKIRLNFPGLESGLEPEEVAPLLLPLPETVTLCHNGGLPRSTAMTFPGFKDIYLQVETLLMDGRQNQAEAYLVENGFDIQSALEQVSAVKRILQARTTTQGAGFRTADRSYTGKMQI